MRSYVLCEEKASDTHRARDTQGKLTDGSFQECYWKGGALPAVCPVRYRDWILEYKSSCCRWSRYLDHEMKTYTKNGGAEKDRQVRHRLAFCKCHFSSKLPTSTLPRHEKINLCWLKPCRWRLSFYHVVELTYTKFGLSLPPYSKPQLNLVCKRSAA